MRFLSVCGIVFPKDVLIDVLSLLCAAAEKKKDSAESSTWALSNFLKEVNQLKENVPASGNSSGK